MIDPHTIPDEMLTRQGKGRFGGTQENWEIYIKDSHLSEEEKTYLLNKGKKDARKDRRSLELLDEIAEGIDGLPQEVLDYLKPNEKEQAMFAKRKNRSKSLRKIAILVLIILNIVCPAILYFLISNDISNNIQNIVVAAMAIPDGILIMWLDSYSSRFIRFDDIHTVSSKYKRYDTLLCPFCTTNINIRYIYFDDIAKKPRNYDGNPIMQCPRCGKMFSYSNFRTKFLAYDEYRRKYLI